MDIKDRIEAMTRNLGALTLGDPVRYGADAAQHHAHSFSVDCDGRPLAQVLISARGSKEDQPQVDEFALVLYHLLGGSEGRVADAERRVSNLGHACEQKDREIAKLRARLAHFERGRIARGPSYAIAVRNGVWLVGRPAADAFGFFFASWHELATEYPGLRPCGVQRGEAGETYIVMRPVGDLARVSVETTARVEDGRVAEIVETRVAPTIRAAIEVNGKPGSARDLPTGSTVVLCSVENTGVATWRWRCRNLPDGSKGLLGNPDKPEAHLRLDVPGAYVVSLEVDDGHGGRSEANVVVQTREGRDERVAPRLHTLVAGWEQVDGIRRAQVVTGSTDGMSRASASVVIQDGPPSTIDLIALAPGQSFDLTGWTYIERWWIEDRYDVFARIRPAAG